MYLVLWTVISVTYSGWLGGGLVVGLVGQFLKEQGEVVAGELPFEGSGGLLVAALEGGEALFDVGQVDEVVRGEDLALDDGVVDLDLVEPGSVDRQLHEYGVGPPGVEAVAGFLAAMAGAVVDHPEHSPGGGVRLDGHDLLDEPGERCDAGFGFATPEDLGPMHVPGGQVLQSTAAVVLVLDPGEHGLGRGRGCDDSGAGLGWRSSRRRR